MNDMLSKLQTDLDGSSANYFVDFINGSLQKANKSGRLRARESYLAVARMKLKDLRRYLESKPHIKLSNLAAFEESLRKVEAETEMLRNASADTIAADDALLDMPLEKQCAILGIPLEVIELDKTREGWIVQGTPYKKPEPAAFAHYKALGYNGTHFEGNGPLSVMKCACLGFLVKHNFLNDPKDACRRYFEAQCEILSDKSDDIVAHIRNSTEEEFKKNLALFIKVTKGETLYPGMDAQSMLALYKGIGPSRLAELAAVFVQDPYDFRAGWPDLALTKQDDVRFIEVKTTDRIHASQRDTFREVLLASGMNVSVVRLKPKRTR